MSTYQTARVSRFRLESLDVVREMIGAEHLSEFDEQYAGNERETSFGEKIQEYIRVFINNAEKLDEVNHNLPPERLDTVSKTIGLYNLLSEDENMLLRSLVEKKMTSRLSDNKLSANNDFKLDYMENILSDPMKCESLFDDLSDAIKEAHSELCRAEQDVIKIKTMESLRELGYTIRAKQHKGEYLIRGTKDLLSVAAQITADGEMNIDMGGFDGKSCVKEMERINNILNRKGIGIDVLYMRYHGKKSGGVLLQNILNKVPMVNKPIKPADFKNQIEDVSVDRRLILLKKNKINRI